MSIHALQRIVDLLQTQELQAQYAGLIDIKTHPSGNLVLLNYTEECQFQGAWDDVTRHCRGLMVDTDTWEIAALPFQKFFNLNEKAESALDVLPVEPFAVFEKLDGSLGITYRRGDAIALATRGAFDSEQALQGTALLNQQINTAHIPPHLTCLFEIILSSGNCISHYDFDGLVLLSAFNRQTGRELDWPDIVELANRLGCKAAHVFAFDTLHDAIASRARLPATFEGYVIRFQSGLRVKVKGDAYLALNKMISGLTHARILSALADGNIDHFRRDVPEEFLDDVDASIRHFVDQAAQYEARIDGYLALAPAGYDRKTFAVWVQENVPSEFRPATFRKFGQQKINWFKFL